MWLVENKVFPKITLFFLVKGHTKNAADRMFNLLKLSYHAKYIFTYYQLHGILNENQYVNVTKMKRENFHNHLEWQNRYYHSPAGGEFNKTHVFTICSNNYGRQPTLIIKQDNYEAECQIDSLLPTTRNRKARKLNEEVRAAAIARMKVDLKELIPTPLRAIKQVELWKKWGPLLPVKFRGITCPKLSDEIIASIKERNKEKTRKRNQEKNNRDKIILILYFCVVLWTQYFKSCFSRKHANIVLIAILPVLILCLLFCCVFLLFLISNVLNECDS
jgi:hypothetical protein